MDLSSIFEIHGFVHSDQSLHGSKEFLHSSILHGDSMTSLLQQSGKHSFLHVMVIFALTPSPHDTEQFVSKPEEDSVLSGIHLA